MLLVLWISIFQSLIKGRYLEHFLWNCLHVNATRPNWWSANSGSGNGLVPSGNKPLTEPMLTPIYVAIWHHRVTISPTGYYFTVPGHDDSNFIFYQSFLCWTILHLLMSVISVRGCTVEWTLFQYQDHLPWYMDPLVIIKIRWPWIRNIFISGIIFF